MAATTKDYYSFIDLAVRAFKKVESSYATDLAQHLCAQLKHFDKNAQTSAVKELSKFYSETLLKYYINGHNDIVVLDIDEYRVFIEENFECSFNIVDKKYKIKSKIEDKEILKDDLELRLHRFAKEHGKKKFNKKHFDMLFNHKSELTVLKPFNPVATIFQELSKQWDGKDYFAELVKCFPVYDYNSGDQQFYNERFAHLFRKWMHKTIIQIMGYGNNETMLLFVSGMSGTGKSKFIEWLLSLFSRYIKVIIGNPSYLPFEKHFSENIFINFDEYYISEKRFNVFKAVLTQYKVEVYNDKLKIYEEQRKIGVPIASTNYDNRNNPKGWLESEDEGFMRRVVTIELSDRINYKYYTANIPIEQLWGQMASEALDFIKFNKELTWESERATLLEINRRYLNGSKNNETIVFDLETLIKNNVNKPQNGEGTCLRPNEILDILQKIDKNLQNNHSNVCKLGTFLNNNNYKQIKNKKDGRTRYNVLIQNNN